MNNEPILIGDCLESLQMLPDNSAHCCVTSPPYFGLRDYGHDGQIGLEPTPDEFVAARSDRAVHIGRLPRGRHGTRSVYGRGNYCAGSRTP